MNSRLALIRADASVGIGTGHVMRCLTLAGELTRRGWRITLASRDLPPDLVRAISQAGIEILGLPAHLAMADEPRWLESRLPPDCRLLVVDHYEVDGAWLAQARARPLAPVILAIDDLADRFLPADLILNQNLVASEAPYQSLMLPAARVLVGPTFALVRPEFAVARDRGRARSGGIDRILVFLSGADRPDVTRRAAEAAEAVGVDVDVVVGAAYPHLAALERWVASHARVELHASTPAMASLMEQADLAIGAPGSASWERCAVGLPSILIVLADNQLELGALLAERGAAITLGSYESIDASQIERSIRALRLQPDRVRAMSEAAAQITDGRGTERVVTEIESLVHALSGEGVPG